MFFRPTNNLRWMLLTAVFSGKIMAQGNDTQLDTVTVEGHATSTTAPSGLMKQDYAGRSRSTVDNTAMQKMPPGNALDALKYTPGVNINSNDSTGLSGLDISVRGMSAEQLGLSMDGVPLNDSGSNDIYPNYLGDRENLENLMVNQGTAGLASPNSGASGGSIELHTRRPAPQAGAFIQQTLGSNRHTRTFARFDTGAYRGLRSWFSYSYDRADKWRGDGSLQNKRFEMSSLFEPGGGNSTRLIVKYQNQDNYNYNTVSARQFKEQGRRFDYPKALQFNEDGHPAGYYKLDRNPFKTLNASLQQHLQLGPDMRLDITPYYYWGDGGSFNGQSASPLGPDSDHGGLFDLSQLPGDTYYRPSWTQTWRPGIIGHFDWTLNDAHSLQLGYWYERPRQRQTQPFIPIENGSPVDLRGTPGRHKQVRDANGRVVQARDQFTVTPTNKAWIKDSWTIDDAWTLSGGLAYQHVSRRGRLAGSLYDLPGKRSASYDEWLPQVSLSYMLDDDNLLFANVSRNMRTPPNYVLYGADDSVDSKPELSWNHELGWRWQRDKTLLSASLFYLRFSDRLLSSSNRDGDSVVLNVGSVVNQGLELEFNQKLPRHFNLYGSYTYTDAKQKDDIEQNGVALPSKGQTLPNTPRQLFSAQLGYDDGRYYGNLGGRYVGAFYGDATNDERISGRTVYDLTAGVRLPVAGSPFKNAALRLSIANLFDKKYLSSARTVQLNARPYGEAKAASPYYNIGEERTLALSLEAAF